MIDCRFTAVLVALTFTLTGCSSSPTPEDPDPAAPAPDDTDSAAGDDLTSVIKGSEESTDEERPQQLARSHIQNTIEAHDDEINACQRGFDDLPPNIPVRFEILASGRVASAQAHGDAKDTDVAACLEEVFEEMQFPAAQTDTGTIRYPVVFD